MAVVALGEPDHPAATRPRVVADGLAGKRRGVHRARHRRAHPGPRGWTDPLRRRRRTGAGPGARRRVADPLVTTRRRRLTVAAAAHRPVLGRRIAARTRCPNAVYPPMPKRCGKFSSRSAPSMAGRRYRWPGRCAGGSANWPAPPRSTEGRDIRIACMPVRRWIGGVSSTSTGHTCCGSARTSRYPAGYGSSCRCTTTATEVAAIVNARCFSRMALPVKHCGRHPPCFVMRCSAVSPAISRRPSGSAGFCITTGCYALECETLRR